MLALFLAARPSSDDTEMEVVAEASVPFVILSPESPESFIEGAIGQEGHSLDGSASSRRGAVEVEEGLGHRRRADGMAASVSFISPRKNMTSFLDPRNVTLEFEVVGMSVPVDGSFEVRYCSAE